MLISHNVAASLRAETDILDGVVMESICFSVLGVLTVVFHVGTGVVDPPLFPTKMARLNLYFRTSEEDEEEEQPLFLILLIPLLPSITSLFSQRELVACEEFK